MLRLYANTPGSWLYFYKLANIITFGAVSVLLFCITPFICLHHVGWFPSELGFKGCILASFFFFFEAGSHCVVQAGLKTHEDPPASVSQCWDHRRVPSYPAIPTSCLVLSHSLTFSKYPVYKVPCWRVGDLDIFYCLWTFPLPKIC